MSQVEIAEKLGTSQRNVSNWLENLERRSEITNPPESREHFDIWQFATSDKDSGQQSYFGAKISQSDIRFRSPASRPQSKSEQRRKRGLTKL